MISIINNNNLVVVVVVIISSCNNNNAHYLVLKVALCAIQSLKYIQFYISTIYIQISMTLIKSNNTLKMATAQNDITDIFLAQKKKNIFIISQAPLQKLANTFGAQVILIQLNPIITTGSYVLSHKDLILAVNYNRHLALQTSKNSEQSVIANYARTNADTRSSTRICFFFSSLYLRICIVQK